MAFSTIQDAVLLGLMFSIMSLGVFVSFRILHIPDLTIDGSFTTGCAVSAICAIEGHPIVGIIMAIVCGAIGGIVTGLLQTKCKIQPLLAGILTMSALYSVNFKLLGNKPNVSLFGKATITTSFEPVFKDWTSSIVIGVIVVLSYLLLFLFLKTKLGICLRATGDNEAMVKALSIHADPMKLLGLGLANAYVGLGGAIFAQHQGFADVSGGIGMMVIALASILIGEACMRYKTMGYQLLSVIVGAVVYRFIITLALQIGIEASDLNIVSSGLVVVAISIPYMKKKRRRYHA